MRRLSGSVAHNFNNLLSVMLNYSYFIEEEAAREGRPDPAGSWESVRQDAARIREAANRATELTHQLLLYARQEDVRPEVLDANRAVDDAKDLIRSKIGQDIELVTPFGPDLRSIFMDRDKFEDVLVALVTNASDAMPTGGLLAIDTSNVTVDEDYERAVPAVESGDYVRLRVSDTGHGMSPEAATLAFEPFFTVKPKGRGSGLGLAIVQGIVAQAGGQIQVYSEPGVGTSVSVLLPATGDVAATIESRPERKHASSAITVLVVEGETEMREVVSRMLLDSGYRVLTATTAPDGVQLARTRAHQIDLLVTDVILAGGPGKELADQIQEVRPTTRVLYMTGYPRQVLVASRTVDEGATLVEEPFSRVSFLASVDEVLSGRA
jgi:CheY-like chemotaxis protein